VEVKVAGAAKAEVAKAGAPTVSSEPSAHPDLAQFEHSYGFAFDDFQQRACDALADGSSVLVAAPTGAGKTVVGEFAAWLALRGGGKTFYTTPIKALSNQKYSDFVALHGVDNVGLLTGDNSVNGEAPIVVMTTEVLRNMIYEDSRTLDELHYVVLDEVHYLQDRYRGAVWEEVLIHLPVDVLAISLSATVSNAEEFAEWLKTLRGRTEVIIEESRPVDIRHWYFAGAELLPMFVTNDRNEPIPNPRGRDSDRRKRRSAPRPERGGRRPRPRRPQIPRRTDVIDRLNGEDMLPAIYFIFSRRGCDDAVKRCLIENLRLTTPAESKEILAYADERVKELTPSELAVLGYDEWAEGLRRGIAAHHAGMIPPFKETVEELFVRGLVKAVFATETLALGINMPARSVVIENLTKFTGEAHELMTPGQYTQLSGRAGRRGIDELGHSVVLLQRFTPFDEITRLASTRTYPLRSSFQPSYNMAVNLVRNYERDEAGHLVNSSFAQFQADRDVVQLEKTRERSAAYLASYKERMACDQGDIAEYKDLLDRVRALEKRHDERRGRSRSIATRETMQALRPGDVIEVTGGRRRGRYAVIEVSSSGRERTPRVVAVSAEKSTTRFAPTDFSSPPRPVGHLRVARDFDARNPRARKELVRRLVHFEPDQIDPVKGDDKEPKELKALRRQLQAHPCHDCPDLSRHLHYADRAKRLEREVRGLERRINRRTQTLARRFELVLKVLEDFSYVKDWVLTPKGELLTSIYNESDLLVIEALEAHIFDGLEPPELAGLVSALVYETRGPETETSTYMPTKPMADGWHKLIGLWRRINREEQDRGVELTREPDPGFAERAYLWTRGMELDEVLDEDDAPGDFVRSVKQLVDLLRQIEDIRSSAPLVEVVRSAIGGLHRGVVAYSSLDI
jgi:ATP-dependent RNA helicase HelY